MLRRLGWSPRLWVLPSAVLLVWQAETLLSLPLQIVWSREVSSFILRCLLLEWRGKRWSVLKITERAWWKSHLIGLRCIVIIALVSLELEILTRSSLLLSTRVIWCLVDLGLWLYSLHAHLESWSERLRWCLWNWTSSCYSFYFLYLQFLSGIFFVLLTVPFVFFVYIQDKFLHVVACN